jgi:REP element-mobilizing transposase RayT
MPDHVHGIIRFGMDSKGMKSELRNWKSSLAKSQNIEWQEGFFDHRIRDDNSFTEKFEYILQNPVRAGLVEQAQDWHWKIVSED